MKYDLFLSDFDGTLVKADGTISENNIAAITKYRKAGGVFAVVTGRMLSSIRPRLKELGLSEGLVVAYQGGMIADIATGKLLKSDTFSVEQAIKAVKLLEAENLHIHIYANDVLYCNRDDEYLRLYEKICGVKGILVDGELLSGFISRTQKPVVKILTMLEREKRDELRLRFEKVLGKEYVVTTSSEWMIEILPAGVSKATAVKYLAEYYHIPTEKVAAIGDQLNDLSMIEAASGKFVVGNAAEELKRIATVVPSVEADGVAEAILKCAMGERHDEL